MRDEFAPSTKRTIGARVGYRCSKPKCGSWTCGPRSETDRAFSLGVAAHITAAAKGGPRYDSTLTPEQRRSATNGIWLCGKCGTLVDADPERYPAEMLRAWKEEAEQYAHTMLVSRMPVADREIYFADVSGSARFGLDARVILENETNIPYAITFNPDDDDSGHFWNNPTFYSVPAYIVRFMVAKKPSVSRVILTEIRAVVHSVSELPPFQRLCYAYPQETSLYLVHLRRPALGKPLRCVAERFFSANQEQRIESMRFAPLVIDDDLPETFDVRFNASESGIFRVSLEVVINHGINSQVAEVLPPTDILFEQFDE